MKHLIYTLTMASLLSVPGSTLLAQNKQETKLYHTSVSKGDLKSLNKFLAKYPESIYAQQITHKRDSILFHTLNPKELTGYENFIRKYPSSEFAKAAQEIIEQFNTSQLSPEEVSGIISRKFNLQLTTSSSETSTSTFCAKSFKKENVEHILALLAPQEKNASDYQLILLKHSGSSPLTNEEGWNLLQEKKEPIYTQGGLNLFRFIAHPHQVTIDGEKYFHFHYVNEHPQNKSIEFITNLFSLSDGTLYSALFSGKKEQEGEESFLEGTCLDASQGGALSTPQMNYLLQYLKQNKSLRPVSSHKFLTDTALEWWYNENKNKTTSLSFAAIPIDHPIALKFNETKEKERGQEWDVAFFDIRENTVVVAYNKSRKQHLLVLCEPTPKNTKTDKFLNTIYFEKEPVLVLFYYKGNTTSKIRINLASRNIR